MSGSDLSLLTPKERNELRDDTARRVHQFLRGLVGRSNLYRVTLDEDQVLLYLDAFRSKLFMDLIENDPALDFQVKAQFAKMSSGLNKVWPAMNSIVRTKEIRQFAAVAYQMVEMLALVLATLGIQIDPVAVALDDGDDDLRPSELAPGEGEEPIDAEFERVPGGEDDGA